MAKTRVLPKQPSPDFPLFAHKNGQWWKKIQGKLHDFGTDADAALTKYLADRDDLQAGRHPRTTPNTTLSEMVNQDLSNADERRTTSELSALSFRDYCWIGERIVAHFGRSVDPTQIRPTEFAAFRNALSAQSTSAAESTAS